MNQHTGSTNNSRQSELLSFKVGEQEYCVDIMSVREIRGWTPPTPIPHSPQYVNGVINLRGVVLPIMNLAERLGIPVEEASERSVIIVMKVQNQMIGLQVDAVSDILAIAQKDMQAPPEITKGEENGFVEALTIVDERMLRILNLEAVLPEIEDLAA